MPRKINSYRRGGSISRALIFWRAIFAVMLSASSANSEACRKLLRSQTAPRLVPLLSTC